MPAGATAVTGPLSVALGRQQCGQLVHDLLVHDVLHEITAVCQGKFKRIASRALTGGTRRSCTLQCLVGYKGSKVE